MTPTSEARARDNEFEQWLAEAFAATGAFTAFVFLLEIAGAQVTPLCSAYLNVIGDEVAWSEIATLFSGSGRTWDGAAFFPATGDGGGLLDDRNARLRLRALESRLAQDRMVLNEGCFFDKWGRRMRIEEVSLP
jgi:hypothetical protein